MSRDRGLRQPEIGRHPPAPLRARRERHLPRDGGPLWRRDHPDSDLQAPGQGQGRIRRALGRALDNRPAAAQALHLARRGQRRHPECVAFVNSRPFKKLDGSRKVLFEALDRPALRPLPPERYEFATWRQAKVNIDYHIEADHHYYSVPHQLVGKVVYVRSSATTIEAFYSSKRVASHLRSFKRGQFTTDPAHMPESPRRYPRWTPSRIINWASTTGPSAAKLVEAIIKSRPHPEQGFRSALGIIPSRASA